MRQLNRPLRARERGYSLMEMLVVVAIIGMISLVSVPAFISFYRSAKMKSSLRQLTGDVRAARQRAVSRNNPVKLSYETGTDGKNKYWMYDRGAANVAETSGFDWTLVPNGARSLDSAVYFATASNFTDIDNETPPKYDLVFLSNGTVSPLPTIADPDFPKVVIMTINTDIPKPRYDLEVNRSGRIKAQ